MATSQTFLMPSVHGWYDLNGFPIQLSERQHGVIYIFKDITQRKYAETELQRQKQYFDAVFQNTPVAILTLDINGHIVTCNPGFERLFGFPQIEVIGRKLDELVTPLEFREQAADFSRRVRRGEIVHDVTRRVTKSGEVIDVDVFNIPMVSEGESLGTLVMFNNISELVRSRRKAEEADLARSEFLSNISLEIRSPINSLIGMLNLTLDTPVTAEQNEYLTTALDNAEALMTHLNDIMDLSRIEAGRLELETTDMNLRAVVENVAAGLAQRADYKGLEFVCMVPTDIPERLRGDPNRLRQVLFNLAGNAVKFTDRGEVTLRVKKVTETDDTATVAFFVQDTGIGITPERQAAIFDHSSLENLSTTRMYGGTGLGLAISTRLVELMGGKITLISEPTSGSTFSFAVVFNKQKEAAETGKKVENNFKDLRVLVVDPSANCRANLTQLLEFMGCRVASAPTTIKAWRLLEEGVRANKPFQVMLIDSKQIFSGNDPILQHIRNTPRMSSVKVLLMNMLGQYISKQDCEKIGCAGYVHKPIRLKYLQSALAGILSPAGFAIPEETPAPRAGAGASGLRTKKVQRLLLVEDNPINSKEILGQLQKFGHLVDLVENGQEAVDACANNHYDLILMDLHIPEMDGFEAADRIRALPDTQSVPIIGLTAQTIPGEIERCKEVGMVDTVSKPVKTQELYEKIEQWTARPAQEKMENESEPLTLPVEDLTRSEVSLPTGSLADSFTLSSMESLSEFEEPLKETWLEANARVNPSGRGVMREFRTRRTKPLGDPQYLESILPRFGNDLNFFINMFEGYVQQCKEKVQDLLLAVQSRDAVMVKLLAHDLKSQAANFESIQVATLTTDLDLQAAQGDLTNARDIVEAIQQEIPELEKRLAEIKVFLTTSGQGS